LSVSLGGIYNAYNISTENMDKINFRKALLSDRPVLLEFEQKVLEAERPYNSTIKSVDAFYYDLDELLNSSKSYLLVAEVDAKVVGSGYAQIRSSKQSLIHDFHSYLGFMYVAAEYRGRGINKSIIERLVEWSQAQGVFDCYLDVYSENESAIQAYKKVGFVNSMIEMKLNLK
jgi:ribosomal protein S18 acetylase RimI-like enzyme